MEKLLSLLAMIAFGLSGGALGAVATGLSTFIVGLIDPKLWIIFTIAGAALGIYGGEFFLFKSWEKGMFKPTQT